MCAVSISTLDAASSTEFQRKPSARALPFGALKRSRHVAPRPMRASSISLNSRTKPEHTLLSICPCSSLSLGCARSPNWPLTSAACGGGTLPGLQKGRLTFH